MNKEQFISTIREINQMLNELELEFGKSHGEFITRKQTRKEVELIAKKWFEEIEPSFNQFGVSSETKALFHDNFSKLLELSLKDISRKESYQKAMKLISQNLNKQVLIPTIKFSANISSIANLANILDNASSEEKEYLNEAIGCANQGFLRASMVLVWCAAVYRLQKVVEKTGFDEFNKKSEEMKAIKEGRFKRFGKSFNIHSLSELRATVFDTDLLWVLEYCCLIDANQHSRLEICFTMRNSAAHPGDAIVTSQNLASAFSDIKAIIFDNDKFKL